MVIVNKTKIQKHFQLFLYVHHKNESRIRCSPLSSVLQKFGVQYGTQKLVNRLQTKEQSSSEAGEQICKQKSCVLGLRRKPAVSRELEFGAYRGSRTYPSTLCKSRDRDTLENVPEGDIGSRLERDSHRELVLDLDVGTKGAEH